MEEAVTKLYSVAGVVLIMMIPLLCFFGIIAYIRMRIDKIEQLYQVIRETVNNEDNPEHNDLHALTTFRQFRKRTTGIPTSLIWQTQNPRYHSYSN